MVVSFFCSPIIMDCTKRVKKKYLETEIWAPTQFNGVDNWQPSIASVRDTSHQITNTFEIVKMAIILYIYRIILILRMFFVIAAVGSVEKETRRRIMSGVEFRNVSFKEIYGNVSRK